MNEREKLTLSNMLLIYCRSRHGKNDTLCLDCIQLEEYAHKRLEHCPFGDDKPVCKKCPVHCYKSEYREKVRNVMRFSGPRMIFYHPIDTIKYLIHSSKKKN